MSVGFLTALFPVLETVLDRVFPDPIKRQEVMDKVQLELLAREGDLIKAASSVIQAEATGESWLQRNWRPLTMISFNISIMGYWFGLTPDLPAYAVESMFTLLQIGIGGYIVGRSAEKIAVSATGRTVVENALEGWRKPK